MDGVHLSRVARAVVVDVAAMLLASLALVSVAAASSHRPTGEFTEFRECPLNRETITNCVYANIGRGKLMIGKREVASVEPIPLQGGYEGSGDVDFFGAENGETLEVLPQPVPGGLWESRPEAWWPDWLKKSVEKLFQQEVTGLTEQMGLAAPATSIKLNPENLVAGKLNALGLPVKFKLNNEILGNHCYIGSDAKPVMIELTTGPSGELKGSPGEVTDSRDATLRTIRGGELVGDSFAVPAAHGCGGIFSYFIDPMLDATMGIPAGEGVNNAVLEYAYRDGTAEAVGESE
jgi:hypothetical protein